MLHTKREMRGDCSVRASHKQAEREILDSLLLDTGRSWNGQPSGITSGYTTCHGCEFIHFCSRTWKIVADLIGKFPVGFTLAAGPALSLLTISKFNIKNLKKCEKQESNLRTPARIDLESIPVDHLGILAQNIIDYRIVKGFDNSRILRQFELKRLTGSFLSGILVEGIYMRRKSGGVWDNSVFVIHKLKDLIPINGPLLHKISKPELLLLLLTKRGGNRKVKHFDPLLGVFRYLVFPADLPGHLEIFLHRTFMHGRDDIAIADPLSLKLRAFPCKGHPPVTRVALGAPELLFGECREVSHEVADEMGSKHPFRNIICIDCTYLFSKDQFCLKLFGHGLELGIHRFDAVPPRYPKCRE